MTSENTAPVSERGGWEPLSKLMAARDAYTSALQRPVSGSTEADYRMASGERDDDARERMFNELCDLDVGDLNAIIEALSASPAPPPPSDVVEEIARIIDPAAWSLYRDDGPSAPSVLVRVKDSLAKARQIAALQVGGGKEGGLVHAGMTGPGSTGKPASDAIPSDLIRYVARYGGMCKGCADEEGVCPASGLPCDDHLKPIKFVLEAVQYGLTGGFVEWPTLTAALSASRATDSADTPQASKNTPSTPPDTPEGVSEAEAAMKEIFAKHGPALREALRPFQTLPAIGDEVVEAIRQMILVEEAEQTRLRSMPSAYSWNKVAVVDGKLDVLRKLSALHQAGKLPAETDMALLRRLVDLTYGFAMEDQSVPSTKVALALIEQAQDDVRDGPKDGLTMKDRLHMRGVNYTPPPPATGGEG